LFGSGETSPSGRKIFEKIFSQLPHAPKVALLETPAGFEPNSMQVIGRVADFLCSRLQNYQPRLSIVRAQARGTPFSPDEPNIVSPLLEAETIFMGPGSPTYAVRQLRASLTWQMILARHRLGAALVLASAATIAFSTYALPVYEIYKVGEDLHWKEGLDFFGLYGLPLVFIPHWNNKDGGEDLDTSRCFMGRSRFFRLTEMLPPDLTLVGIDEKTALIMDIRAGTGSVAGLGGVSLIHTGPQHAPRDQHIELQDTGLHEIAEQRQGHLHYFTSGESFPLNECCPFDIPDLSIGISPEVWQQALEAQSRLEEQSRNWDQPPVETSPPAEVLALVEERQAARARKDWISSDALRSRIVALGWVVEDTPEGFRLSKR
jgi:hypothetical protein